MQGIVRLSPRTLRAVSHVGPSTVDTVVRCLECFIRQLQLPWTAAVGLELTSQARIRAINKVYRKINLTTDVLSFPALDWDRPGETVAPESLELIQQELTHLQALLPQPEPSNQQRQDAGEECLLSSPSEMQRLTVDSTSSAHARPSASTNPALEDFEVDLGDMFICPDYIASTLHTMRQTPQEGGIVHDKQGTLDAAICVVAAHGLCHLVGYTHDSQGDAKQMFDIEQRLLRSCCPEALHIGYHPLAGNAM